MQNVSYASNLLNVTYASQHNILVYYYNSIIMTTLGVQLRLFSCKIKLFSVLCLFPTLIELTSSSYEW